MDMRSDVAVELARGDEELAAYRFETRFVGSLPADPVERNVPRQVPAACYTRVMPTPVDAPELLAWADPVGELLGLSRPAERVGPVTELLAGNLVLPGMVPYAARYGGHQFGHWAGQLGDGRAITLGEMRDRAGGLQELQLKGAGKTPYSRTADGRAVLRSSLREFLCSEAMFALGVPTTRALSLVATGNAVVRDMFYDGHAKAEPGAVVCRVAPSFVRFGNFQIHAAFDEVEILRRLADFVIATQYPALAAIADPVARYAEWFAEICRRTAIMVAHWMRVGFVHGVMNTDNMSILGLTIDYGPYGWLEGYDPAWTPNTTDADGRRYCFARQPQIAQWNLCRLADALLLLVPDQKLLEAGLAEFAETFETASRRMTADKLGWQEIDDERDGALLDDLFELLQASETDMTIFFRQLANVPVAGGESGKALITPLRPAFYAEESELPGRHLERMLAWLRRYGERVRSQAGWSPEHEAQRRARMNRTNPKYVPRNYLAQLAIDGLMEGESAILDRLMAVLQRPYDEQPENEDLAVRRPEWARHKAGCSALSCSS
ncbi:MAG TPA: YdiU family protein [Rhodocyclaceae bacterium]|nr:YdiU family protein [Rhodocyclaceae bacterium]